MMVAAPVFMLRTVKSNGDLDQYLPDFSQIDMSPVYGDAGTVTFSYPLKGVNFGLLKEDLEIAVLMNGVEIGDLRCIIETIEGDDADDAEEGALWKYTCRTMAGQLDYAIVYPDGYSTSNPITTTTVATFNNMTVGGMIITLFQRAQARGAMQGLTWDFTSGGDSEGNAWPDYMTMSFDAGKTYSSILKDLVDGGWCEWKVTKRVISLYVYGNMGVDRSVGSNPVRFIKGRDIKDAPRKTDTRNLFSAALINGSNSAFLEVKDATSISTYGRREGYYSINDLPWFPAFPGHKTLLQLHGEQWLAGQDKPQVEVTHGLHFETEDQPRPVTNFNVGDWALSDVGLGVERFRIMQWVMSVDNAGNCTGSITMNWLFNTQLSQVAGSVNQLKNGTIGAGAAARNDGVAPAKVSDPLLSSANYFVNMIPRSNLTVQWAEVTTNSDGTTISDLDHYQVRWKYTSDSAWRASQRIENDTLNAIFQNLDPGKGVQAQVQAVDVWNNHGAWSNLMAIVTAGDTIAPLKPATPTLQSNVGTLRVIWTGLDYTGAAQPADLAGVEVHLSTSDFTPSSATLKTVLPPGVLTCTITEGLTYGVEYWVKLIAYDTTGNRSPASDTTSASHTVLKQVVTTEIGTGQVGLAQVMFSDVGNLIDDGTFENSDKRASRVSSLPANMSFDSTTASNGGWSLRADSSAGGPTLAFKLQGGLPVKPGERVFGAADYRLSTTVPSGSYASVAISWLDKNGNQLDNTGATALVTYSLSDCSLQAKDNAWHSRVVGASISQTAPPNAVAFDIWYFVFGLSAGQIWVDAVEIRKQIDTALIQTAAITTALIANLAVNDAKISDLSVGKLTAGTLSADMVVGARIKTADTGARVELNSGGIGAWNSSGIQTVAIAGADGSVNIIGQLRSGSGGQRVEINPTSTLLPEIRFFPTTGSNYAFINAVASGDGTKSFIGVNSGQFSLNGTTEEFRLYMTDVLCSLETIKVSDQSRLGGYAALADTWFNAAYTDGSRDYGHVYAEKTMAEIGFNGSTDSTDSWTTYNSDGTYTWIGRSPGYVSAYYNQAVFASAVSWTSNSGVILSYGPTMITNPMPMLTLYYTGSASIAWWLNQHSTTTFSISCTVSNTGAAASINAWVHFWAFR